MKEIASDVWTGLTKNVLFAAVAGSGVLILLAQLVISSAYA